MIRKKFIALFFLSLQISVYSQLDSGRYNGRDMDLYILPNNNFKITGMIADHIIAYRGNYSTKGDTLLLTENKNPTRTSYYLLKKDSITYLKHYVMLNGKIIDHYYKNYVFKDSNDVKEIGLANYSFASKTDLPWGFSFIIDTLLEEGSLCQIASYSFKCKEGFNSKTSDKIISITKINQTKRIVATKDFFARMFEGAYKIDGFRLYAVTLTKLNEKNINADFYYKKLN